MTEKELIEKIKAERIKKGISLQAMGRALGSTGQKFSCIERGLVSLKMKDYFKICEVLGVSAKDLIAGDVSEREYHHITEQIRNLDERDFKILQDLVILMGLKKEDL